MGGAGSNIGNNISLYTSKSNRNYMSQTSCRRKDDMGRNFLDSTLYVKKHMNKFKKDKVES